MATRRRKPAGCITGFWLILGLLILRNISSGDTTSNSLPIAANTVTVTRSVQALATQTSKNIVLVATNTPTLTPTLALAVSIPQAFTNGVVLQDANLRQGPGTNYAIVDSMTAGQTLEVTGQNGDGSWYQVANQTWIASFLVSDIDTVFSIIDTSQIPTLPPTSQLVDSATPTLQLVDSAPPTVTPNYVPAPATIPVVSPMPGLRYGAICQDGTRSNATGRGACSHHGGVSQWLVH